MVLDVEFAAASDASAAFYIHLHFKTILMTHPKIAQPDHPIMEVLASRWSPYVFSDRPVPVADLQAIFEAARWAASSYNEQPWRFLVATKTNQTQWEAMLSCLVDANQAWAKTAPVLAIGCTTLHFALNGKPNAMAAHDLGLASGNLSVQATARGLAVHQMAGILPDRIRSQYKLPDGTQAVTALAIGYAAEIDSLSPEARRSETTPRTRRPLSEFVFEGRWGQAAEITGP